MANGQNDPVLDEIGRLGKPSGGVAVAEPPEEDPVLGEIKKLSSPDRTDHTYDAKPGEEQPLSDADRAKLSTADLNIPNVPSLPDSAPDLREAARVVAQAYAFATTSRAAKLGPADDSNGAADLSATASDSRRWHGWTCNRSKSSTCGYRELSRQLVRTHQGGQEPTAIRCEGKSSYEPGRFDDGSYLGAHQRRFRGNESL